MGKVLITGTSSGVGRACAVKFLQEGHQVVGLDIKNPSIKDPNYTHYVCDCSKKEELPKVGDIEYLLVNHGIVTPQSKVIDVNGFGYINVIEKYAEDPKLKSILFVGSSCIYKGFDNIRYNFSKGGQDSLMMWCTYNYSSDSRHVLCNIIHFDCMQPSDNGDGVSGTNLEPELYADQQAMEDIRQLSILKKIPTVEELADVAYFYLVTNKIITGNRIIIDGEYCGGGFKFVKYDGWDA